MSNNPIVLTVQFLLELAMLAALAVWGWTEHAGLLRVVLTVGLPVIAAVLWGTFRVPNDPNEAPVAVPGVVRLILELDLFTAAVVLLYLAGEPRAAGIFGAAVVVVYTLSYDRVLWLLGRRRLRGVS
jgi:hypothetical protein